MATYHRVYDSRHLQADCKEPGSAPEPYTQQSSMGYLYLFFTSKLNYVKKSVTLTPPIVSSLALYFDGKYSLIRVNLQQIKNMEHQYTCTHHINGNFLGKSDLAECPGVIALPKENPWE